MRINKIMVLPLALAMLVFTSIGSASAQTIYPKLAIQLATAGLTSPLMASTNGSTVARLTLDTTGSPEAVRISTLPFLLTVGNGAIPSTLNNCRVYNEANSSVAMNSNNPVTLASGLNSVILDTALILNANTVNTFALRCDVASNLVFGGTYTVSMNTSNVVATGASTGLPATVSVRGAVTPPVVYPPYTPGIPSTGASGELTQNITMLIVSLFLASLGFSAIYLKKKPEPTGQKSDSIS